MSGKWNPQHQYWIDQACDELLQVLADAHARLDLRDGARERSKFRFKSGDLDPIERWPADYLEGAA